ncbi:MAG: putative Ig domain-containing protein, partial [Blastocatellia bacterium]
GGVVQSYYLEGIHLAVGQVITLNLQRALKKAGAKAPFVNAGLTLNYSGAPGGLIGHIASVDQTGNYVFDTPCKDPLVSMNRSGSYPWDISGDNQAVIHIRNSNDQKSRYILQLDFASGSYALPVGRLAPQQEAAIDIRALRDKQVHDSTGRTIPSDVTNGLARWLQDDLQPLTGRLEAFSPTRGVASSFSCGNNCPNCPATTVVPPAVSPAGVSGNEGDTFHLQILRTTQDQCGNTMGPFDDSADVEWLPLDVSAVTIGAVDSQGVAVTLNCASDTSISVQYQHWVYDGQPVVGDPDCEATSQTDTIEVPVSVTTDLQIATSVLPPGETNAPYKQTLAATGGTQPYTWSIVSGSLPPGFSLVPDKANASQVVIQASTPMRPTEEFPAGIYTFTVGVASMGCSKIAGTIDLSLEIDAGPNNIQPVGNLATGTVGVAYTQTVSASGGTVPFTWTIDPGGALPPGLALSIDGIVSGVPTL